MARKKRRKRKQTEADEAYGWYKMELNSSYAYAGIGEFVPKNRVKEVIKVLTSLDNTPPCLQCGGHKVYEVKEALRHTVTGWMMDRTVYQCAQCGFAMAASADFFIPDERMN